MSKTFELQRVSGSPGSDSKLLADILFVAKQLNSNTVSMPRYNKGKSGYYRDKDINPAQFLRSFSG